MNESKILFQARFVAPITEPVISNGAVVADHGKIVAVGPAAALRREHADALVREYPGHVILPGLVNAHAHLELSSLLLQTVPPSFEDWLLKLVPRGAPDFAAMQKSAEKAIPAGRSQCLEFGVTTVGDISRQCAVTRPLLNDPRQPLRVVGFGEVQGMASRRTLLAQRIDTAIDASAESSILRVGLSPHAPYSVEIDGYRRCVEIARERRLPLSTHLAESRHEAEFLARHTGPFRALWSAIGGWDDAVPTFDGGPIRFAKAAGLLDYPTVLAHVNYCDDDELKLLADSSASVVYCPRTHAYFGHPPHRWRDMLNRGINVALGTDSCASSPNLNLLDDLRLVRRNSPEWPVDDLWKLITVRGAQALGMGDSVGSLEAGKQCDLVMFEVSGDDPLAEIIAGDLLPREIWIGASAIRFRNSHPA